VAISINRKELGSSNRGKKIKRFAEFLQFSVFTGWTTMATTGNRWSPRY
jgi:hypothetical protein